MSAAFIIMGIGFLLMFGSLVVEDPDPTEMGWADTIAATLFAVGLLLLLCGGGYGAMAAR